MLLQETIKTSDGCSLFYRNAHSTEKVAEWTIIRGGFAKAGQRDSAEVYSRRALESPEHAQSAAIQLGVAARNQHKHDTVFHYFQKSATLFDSIIEPQNKSFTRDLEAFYQNHEHEQKIAAQRITILTETLICVVVLLLAVAGFLIAFFYRHRINKTREELHSEQTKREELELQLLEIMDRQQDEMALAENGEVHKSFHASHLQRSHRHIGRTHQRLQESDQ